MSEKVLVAMSGGVDSSVAAYLIREAGYEATGVTMRLYDNETIGISSAKTCCSLDSINDAVSVANRLGIYFLVYDFREEFKKEVIQRFIDSYGGSPRIRAWNATVTSNSTTCTPPEKKSTRTTSRPVTMPSSNRTGEPGDIS